MTPEELGQALVAINRVTMDLVLPGGVWTILLLGASQVAASVVLIFLLLRIV